MPNFLYEGNYSGFVTQVEELKRSIN